MPFDPDYVNLGFTNYKEVEISFTEGNDHVIDERVCTLKMIILT